MRSTLRTYPVALFVLFLLGGLIAVPVAVDAAPPKDRVVAMYFHRTQRCSTCKKMGAYTEEAIKQRFAKELKAGTVEFHHVDFQNKKNAKLTKAYKINGPALVMVRVKGNKPSEFKNLKDIWANAPDKKAFCTYVADNVDAYLKKQAQ